MTPRTVPSRPEDTMTGAPHFYNQWPARQSRGFALAVVLLLASVVLGLVVAMSLMTQMQLKAASVVVSEAKARQDALLGMRVAVGQIQKELGPDQRTTFRSDLFVPSTTVGGVTVQQPYWTGVLKTYRPGGTSLSGAGTPSQELDNGYDEYNNLGANLRSWSYGLTAQGAPTLNATMTNTAGIYSSTLATNTARNGVDAPDQGGVQWLVSAPAPVSITATNANRLSPLSQNPNVTPPDGPAITGIPTKLIISNIDKDTAAYRTLARVEDATGLSHAVRAFKVGIQGDPVLTGGTTLTGNYAYWVSDEGMKAKATLVSPWTPTIAAGTNPNYAFNQLNFTVPQRMAVEKIPLIPSTTATRPIANGIGQAAQLLTALSPIAAVNTLVNTTTAGFVTGLHQASSLAALANVMDLATAKTYSTTVGVGRFFPDITVYSQGVLSDVRKGGLKVDLTAAFENVNMFNNTLEGAGTLNPKSLLGRVRAEYPSTTTTGDLVNDEKVYRVGLATATFQFPVLDSPFVPTQEYKNNGMRWDTLFLYYNLYKGGGGGIVGGTPNPYNNGTYSIFAGVGTPAASGSANMRLYNYNNTVHEAALVPRLLNYEVYFQVTSQKIGTSFGLLLEELPAITLYNPYNVTLTAPANYQFSVYTGVTPQITIGPFVNAHYPPPGDTINLPTNGVRGGNNVGQEAMGLITGSKVYTFGFVINPSTGANLSLEPGEVRVYTEPSGVNTQYGLSNNSNDTSYFKDLTDTVGGLQGYHSVLVSDGITPNVTALFDPGEKPAVSQGNNYTHSSSIGFYSISAPTGTTNNEWPSTNGEAIVDPVLANGIIGQAPEQQLGKLTFRGFGVFPPNVPSGYTIGSGTVALGAVAFFAKGASPRGFADAPGGNWIPLNNPAVPIFASVAPQANPFSLSLDTSMLDGMTQLDSLVSASSNIYSVQAVPHNGHLETYWGRTTESTEGLTHVVMRDVPRAPMTSLGQFMHVNLNYWVTDLSTSAVPQLPNAIASFDGGDGGMMNPVGGSLAPADFRGVNNLLQSGIYDDTQGTGYLNEPLTRMEKAEHRLENNSSFNSLSTSGGGAPGTVDIWDRDDNFLANEALFDTYFFSTVPSSTWTGGQATGVTGYAPRVAFNAAYVAGTTTASGLVANSPLKNPLPNSRMTYYSNSGAPPPVASLQDIDKAAASLMLNGAFNINSTSVDAWVALLSSLSGNPLQIWNMHDGLNQAQTVDIVALKNPILRFTAPYNTFDTIADDVVNHPFQGVRGLSDGEIRDLAMKIVEQVKLRGPFLSLGDFLNRRLVNDSTQPYYTSAGAYNNFVRAPSVVGQVPAYTLQTNFSRKGALQAAIDESTVNDYLIPTSPTGSPGQPALPAGYATAYPTGDYTAVVEVGGGFGNTPAGGGLMNLQGEGTDINNAPENSFGNTHFQYRLQDPLIIQNLPQLSATGIPGWLMQQDIVEDFSSVMAARSDTFVVRFYGETTNPATGSVDARAYGEAVVQRYPDFMDSSVSPETKYYHASTTNLTAVQNHLYDLTTQGTANFNPLIYAFGRRFRIVSIRWLSANDI